MASEVSNIAGLFCVDSTASVIPADKNTKVQNDFSTFLNTGGFWTEWGAELQDRRKCGNSRGNL